MATLWDLYATFGSVAGLSAAEASDAVAAAASLPAVDSIDQWPWWSGVAVAAPRIELAIGTAAGSSHGGGNVFRATGAVQDCEFDSSPPTISTAHQVLTRRSRVCVM